MSNFNNQRKPNNNQNHQHQHHHNQHPSHRRSFAQMMKSWHELYTIYLKARHTYYIHFDFVELRRVKQLEKEFFKAGESLRIFESRMTHAERQYFFQRVGHYKLDDDYSKALPEDQLAPTPVVPKSEIEDPHFYQKISDEIKVDKEESCGTMDDYVRYKGSAKQNR